MESQKQPDSKKEHPRDTSSFITKLFHTWTIPIFITGFKNGIKEDNIYRPLKAHYSHALGNKLEEAWQKQIKSGNKSLYRCFWSISKWDFILYLTIYFCSSLIGRLLQPLLLMQILNYYEPGRTDITKTDTYLYVLGLFLASFVTALGVHYYVLGMQQLGIKLRVALCSLIYRKVLKLSYQAMTETSTGQIVTLLSTDVRIFDYVMLEIAMLMITPIDSIAFCLLLYFLLGGTSLIGIGFLLLFIPFQMYLSKLVAIFRLRIALQTDKRVLLMNEIISGVKVIKMYTWEKPFSKLVEIARRLEVRQIRKKAFVDAIEFSYSSYMNKTAIALCIICYVLLGNRPVAQYVFVVTTVYNVLAKTISVNFATSMSTYAHFTVSCKRITKFLLLDEVPECALQLDGSSIGIKSTEKKSFVETEKVFLAKEKALNINGWSKSIPVGEVSIKSGYTSWSKSFDEPSLADVNFEARSHELIAIVGPVGSGKSTLINVILKELPLLRGQIHVKGTISYTSQEPWLFKGSIKQNILFGEQEDVERYRKVINVCALEHDLDMFPYGDASIIGEKGVMLSGGQKARISLARAVYKKADIYILDDPLSAVDAHVGRQLFDICISDYLKDKCTILVTHQLQYLGSATRIYMLENGRITASGDYFDIMQSGREFAKMFNNLETEDESDVGVERVVKVKKEQSDDLPKDVKEEIARGSMDISVYKRYFCSGGPWYVYATIWFLFVINQVIGSGVDYFITYWVNLEQIGAFDNENQTTNHLNTKANTTIISDASKSQATDDHVAYFFPLSRELCIYIYSGLLVLLVIVTLIRTISYFQYCLSSSTKLHNNMFVRLIRAPMRFFNTNPSGRILNRFSKDIGAIDEVLPSVVSDTLVIGLYMISVTVIVGTLNPFTIIPTVVLLALFYLYKQIFVRTSRDLKRIEGIARSPIFSHLNASLQGMTTIRAFKAQRVLEKEFDNHQDFHSATFYMFLGCSRAFGLLLDINCMIYMGLVSVLTLVTTSFGGNIGLAISQALTLTGRLQWGIRQWSEMENQMTSVERVLEYTQLDPEEDHGRPATKEWPVIGTIEFRSVYLRYAIDEAPILTDLNFVIEPREKIGIVGRTGAGKSSLISAIFRLCPTEGSIVIDGVDTKDVTLETLRSKISIIPQEPFLFSGTLRKNLDPFEEFNDNVLWDALEDVELKGFFHDSVSGLNYPIAEGGSNLSVGQRQLLCLARAVIRNNKILIMDEATANVDPRTDELIQLTIRNKFSNCTVLTVAHRLYTIMDSDKVLVMDRGRVVEFGHPYELLQNENGVFYSLVSQIGSSVANSLMEVARENYYPLSKKIL